MHSAENQFPTAPAALLSRIQDLCREWGIFGRNAPIRYRGRQYLVGCTEEAFAVYRLVPNCHLPPGSPGWPVCLVTRETVVDETSPPELPGDEFASGLSLQGWLDLMEKTFRT